MPIDRKRSHDEVSEVMTANPASCTPDVEDVERITAERQVRRVPAIDRRNCHVGAGVSAAVARNDRAR